MWNFDSADKAIRALPAETKFHIQKYDGLENIEKQSPPSEENLHEALAFRGSLYPQKESRSIKTTFSSKANSSKVRSTILCDP
jgi:hypothetical protein